MRRFYVGKQVRVLREKRGLSQLGLAQKVARRPETIARWENDEERGIKDSDCRALAKALGVSFTELVKEDAVRELQHIRDQQAFHAGQYAGSLSAKIPVVSRAGASTETGRFEFESVENEWVDFKGVKAVEVVSDSMAPVAYRGQKILYSETESPVDGDLVFCKVKGRGQLFKRYHVERRDGKRYVALVSLNATHKEPPIIVLEDHVEWCYKVVGVRF